jgi:nucleotide-binding universal stress UspA family protein
VGEAAAAAPADVIVHTVRRTGSVGKEIVAEIESGGYDLIILGARGHGRISSEILGQRQRSRPFPLERSRCFRATRQSP